MQFVTCLLQALVDAPDMVRSQMNFKRISLTDIKIDINRVPKKKALIEAMEKAGKGVVLTESCVICALNTSSLY